MPKLNTLTPEILQELANIRNRAPVGDLSLDAMLNDSERRADIQTLIIASFEDTCGFFDAVANFLQVREILPEPAIPEPEEEQEQSSCTAKEESRFDSLDMIEERMF